VGNALALTGGDETLETSKFVCVFDKFFDALNVSNFTNGTRKRKPFQHPYRSADDFRLAVSFVANKRKFLLCSSIFAVAGRSFSVIPRPVGRERQITKRI